MTSRSGQPATTGIHSARALQRGSFYVLDGVDGCGKSTQARDLSAKLEARATERGAPSPLHLREPGSTSVGERLRALLLDPAVSMGPACETLLFTAARRQMLDEVVEPALAGGRDVVCERFHGSTFAYQAVAGELGEEEVLALLAAWAGEPLPDLTLVLDLDVEEAHGRVNSRGEEDRMEARGVEFQRRVAQGYRRYAERVEGVRVVPASGGESEVAARIWQEVQDANR